MKTLYLECNMGASGDMLLAALSELLPEPEKFAEEMNALRLPGVAVRREYRTSAGIRGAHMRVFVHGEEEESCDLSPEKQTEHHHHGEDVHHHHDDDHHHPHGGEEQHHHDHGGAHHHHTTVSDVEAIIAALAVSERVKADAKAVYGLIAEAESAGHGQSVEQIHFHEVGTLDAIADVVGVCMLMEKIGAGQIVCSPIHVGCGMVHCAHGVLPVPAPATAYLLRGVPIYGGSIRGELCTPTGAALLKYFSSAFGPMPPMIAEKIGIGLGSKEFPAANMLRAFLGEGCEEKKTVEELSCNLDDCTGEELGFAIETLMQQGALDVFATAIQMKKSRPGILLTVISKTEDAERLTELMLRHTTTLGVRRKTCGRTSLHRRVETRQTPLGPVRVKVAEGHGVRREKAEFEDLAALARGQDLSLREVREKIEK